MDTWRKAWAAGACVGLLAAPAFADLTDLESLQSAHPALEYQYAFEGATDATRLADGSPNGHDLQRIAGIGGGDERVIQFPSGFDATSQAYRPARDPVDHTVGACLTTIDAAVVHANAITFETVAQLDAYTDISSGQGSYLVSARPLPTAGRAYLLRQLATPNRVATTLGNTLADLGGNIPYAAGDWYYFAVVATYAAGPDQSTVSWYFANLSDAEPALTAVGPDSTLFQGDWTGAGRVGVGCFLTGQDIIAGALDNAAMFNAALSQTELQSHLDAIYLPEPAGAIPVMLGVALVAGLYARR